MHEASHVYADLHRALALAVQRIKLETGRKINRINLVKSSCRKIPGPKTCNLNGLHISERDACSRRSVPFARTRMRERSKIQMRTFNTLNCIALSPILQRTSSHDLPKSSQGVTCTCATYANFKLHHAVVSSLSKTNQSLSALESPLFVPAKFIFSYASLPAGATALPLPLQRSHTASMQRS